MGETLLVGKDRLAGLLVNLGLDVETPEDTADTEEQAALGDVDTGADAAACAKGELVALGVVGVGGGVAKRLVVVLVAVGIEAAGFGVAGGVHVDAPDIVDDSSILGDEVTVVDIILGDGVGDGAHDGGGHPAERLFHDSADVLKVVLVLHGGEAAVANDAVNLFLGLALDVGVEEHGLNKGVESAGGGVGAGFEEGTRDVGSLVVREAFGLLGGDQLLTEAALDGSGEGILLGLEPVGEVESLLRLVELTGLGPDRQEEIGEIAQEGEEVDQGGEARLVELSELGEAIEELLQLLVLVGGRAPAKDHGGGESIGVAADVVQEVVWVSEDVVKHLLVLEHLVGDVGLGGRDVEQGVDHLAAHAPSRCVSLWQSVVS